MCKSVVSVFLALWTDRVTLDMQQTKTTFTAVSSADSLVHSCKLIMVVQTSMVTTTVVIFLAWTPALRSRKLKQKLPCPPRCLRVHQSRLEPQHRLLQRPLVTAQRTTHARPPRSPSPLTQKPQSWRTAPDPPRMHPRTAASTPCRIHPRPARARTRISPSRSQSSGPVPALGQCTRFLRTPTERPRAHRLARRRRAVLRRYRLSRPSGLRR